MSRPLGTAERETAQGFARWAQHFLFWAVFFGVNLFTELYTSNSFQLHPSWELLGKAALLQLLLVVPKALAVYYLLYLFLPRWGKSRSRSLLLLEGVGVFLGGLMLYRFVVQFVGWRVLYDEVPQGVSLIGYVARWLYSLLDLLEVAGVAFAVKLLRLRIAAQRKEAELVRQKLESEMQLLRAQMQPHFLFNSLNTIYALALQRSENAPEAVMRLSQILRYVLYESGKPLVPLERELSLIRDYVDLQGLRFGEKVKVTLEVQVGEAELMIAPMLIFPLVENAYKHGVGAESDGSEILVSVETTGTVVKVRVKNRVWRQSVPGQKEEGIGLRGVRRLMELQYPSARMEHREEDGFFTVDLEINTRGHESIELPDR